MRIWKRINQLIVNKAYNRFTYQLVYSSTKNLLLKTCSYVTLSLHTLSTSNLSSHPHVNLLLERTLFLCYFVFNYSVYNQLVHSSTRLLVHYKSVNSPTFRSLSLSVCKKDICSFCFSVSSVRECFDRVAFCFIFSQIAQINRVHRTHRNLKVIDNTER